MFFRQNNDSFVTSYKSIYPILLFVLVLSGCLSTQNEQSLLETGKIMQAIITECTHEELTRANAVEQMECIDNGERQAAYEMNYDSMWILEQSFEADHISAVEYEEGKIDQEAYITAIQKNWTDALRIDEEVRAKSRREPIKHAKTHLQDLEVMSG